MGALLLSKIYGSNMIQYNNIISDYLYSVSPMALYKNRFENLEDKHNTIYNDKNQKKKFLKQYR